MLVDFLHQREGFAEGLVIGGLFLQHGHAFAEGNVPRFSAAQVFLHEVAQLGQATAPVGVGVGLAEDAPQAVGREALPQSGGQRLGQAFQHLAHAEARGEQAADGVHRSSIAAVHADLGLLQGVAHGLGLVDMHVPFGGDVQLGQLQEGGGLVVFLQGIGLGLDPLGFGLKHALAVGGAQGVDLHLRPSHGPRLAFDSHRGDLLGLAVGVGPHQRGLGLLPGGVAPGFRLGQHVHLGDLGLVGLVDFPGVGLGLGLQALHLAAPPGVRDEPHRFRIVFGLQLLGGDLQPLDFRLFQFAGLVGGGDLALLFLQFAGQKALDIHAFAFLILGDEGDFAAAFLQLDGQVFPHPFHIQLGILGHQGDFAVPLLGLAGQIALNFRRLAFFHIGGDGDVLGNPGLFQSLGLLDFLLLHLPALFQQETLLLREHAGLLVGHLAFLPRGGESVFLVHFQGAQARFQALFPHGQAGFLGYLVPVLAPLFLVGGHGGDAVDFGRLPALFLGNQLDFAIFFRRLAGQVAGDGGQFFLPGLADQFDLAVLLGFFQGQVAGDVDQFFFPGLGDQFDLAGFFLQFQRQRLLHLGDFTAAGLFGEIQVAFGAQFFQILLVGDFLAVHPQALIEDVDLFFLELEGLFVGHLLVLRGPGECFRFFDLQHFQLRVQIPLADGHGGTLFGVVNRPAGVGGDFGDDFQPLGVENVVPAEMFLGGLFQGHDGHLFKHQAVGPEALGDVFLDGGGEDFPIFMELFEGPGGRIAAQGAHYLGFQQVAHLFGIEGFFPQRTAGLEHFSLGMAHMSVQFRHHVHPDIVLGQKGLFPRAADDELDGFQRNPGHLVKHGQHQRPASQAHFRAQQPGADKAHVGGGSLVDPDGEDVDDRDHDHKQDPHGYPGLVGDLGNLIEKVGHIPSFRGWRGAMLELKLKF